MILSDRETSGNLTVDNVVALALLGLNIEFCALEICRLLAEVIFPYVLCDLLEISDGI